MMQAVTEPATPDDKQAGPPAELAGWLKAVASHRDRAAFEGLFSYFAPRIKGYMLRLGADAALAEDLAQETLVQVWRKAAQYDPAKALPSAWVFTVARNLRIDRLRRQRFHEVELTAEAEQEDDRADGHARALERIDAGRLAGPIRALPPQQLEVVQLAFFEGLSHGEIVERLGIPLGTVKSRLRLAFRKLRAALGEDV